MGRIDCKSLSYKTPLWQGEYSCTFGTGEWHVLCGGSGAGKSTLLHLMLGLTEPTSGDIVQDGVSLAALPPHKRQMSFMSQLNALFPGITVEDNLMLALYDSSFDFETKKKKIGEMADHLRIRSELLERLPSKLSGGELSRCNLARALLRPCRWLLLDEPFAAVDDLLRLRLQEDVRRLYEQKNLTTILVTHNLHEAVFMSDRVVVLGGSPSRVVDAFTVSGPRERTAEFRQSSAFFDDLRLVTAALFRTPVSGKEVEHA